MIHRFLRRHSRTISDPKLRIVMLIISILSLFAAGLWDSFLGSEITLYLMYALSCVTAALFYGYVAGFINSVISIGVVYFIHYKTVGTFSFEYFVNMTQLFIILNFMAYLTYEVTVISGNRKDTSIDPLTGALKGKFFKEILDREAENARDSGRVYSFLIFDYDDFTKVNNEHGKAEADELLGTTGKSVMANIRPHDVFSRLEGDRFALLLPGIAHREADLQTDMMFQILANIITLKKWPVTISSVLLTVKDRSMGAGEILRLADDELRQVKKTARGSKKKINL